MIIDVASGQIMTTNYANVERLMVLVMRTPKSIYAAYKLGFSLTVPGGHARGFYVYFCVFQFYSWILK